MAVDDRAAGLEVSEPVSAEVDIDVHDEDGGARPAGGHRSPVRSVVIVGTVVFVVFVAVAAWAGFNAYQTQQAADKRDAVVHVARQVAVNLTSIDHQHAEADVQRVRW
jgi:Mce-associated membrane protein